MYKKILDRGLTVGYFTRNNFHNPNAKTYIGSTHTVRNDFRTLLKTGLILPIPSDKKIHYPVKEQFYQVSDFGARSIDREDEYKRRKEYKAVSSVDHESMKIDIALQFLDRFSDRITFDYTYSVEGARPDILVKWRKPFLVEIERKRTPGRVMETIRKWNRDQKMPVLIVYAPIDFPALKRPKEWTQRELDGMAHDFANLMKIVRAEKLSNRFYFTSFVNYHRIHEAVWFNTRGEKVKIA
jgi:hypothetical protein